jgi:hypothetical protein
MPLLPLVGLPLLALLAATATAKSSDVSLADSPPSDLLGKKVMMEDGKTLGAIADVMLQDGKPSAAIVALEAQKKRQVTVTLDKLSQQAGDYQIALTEAEIRTLPPYNGPKEGQTSASELEKK